MKRVASKKGGNVRFGGSDELDNTASQSKKGSKKDGITLGMKEVSQKKGESSEKTKTTILYEEDDKFHTKWAGPLILGPFIVCIFAVIVIVSGQLVLNSWVGTCGYPLDVFISMAVSVCYLFLIVYTWVFLGDTMRLKIAMLGIDWVILQPFTSLQWLMGVYAGLSLLSFVIWSVGTNILSTAALCVNTAPMLFNFTTFLVAIYWLGFCIICIYTIKLFYGETIVAVIKEQVRAPTMSELEDRVFRKSFAEFDKAKEQKIAREDVPKLLQALGVYVPDKEIATLLGTLDPHESGSVTFEAMDKWFKQLNSMADEGDNNKD